MTRAKMIDPVALYECAMMMTSGDPPEAVGA